MYLKGLEAAYKAVGANNATVDSKAATAAVIADINANGGAAGRKLVPGYFAVDANSTQDRTAQLAAACAYFTQDHPVDIVVSYTGGALVGCLAKYGVPLVNGYPGSGTPASGFAANELYFAPSQMSLTRLADLLPSFLVQRHRIDARWPSAARCAAVSEPRLGVITFDEPEYRRVYSERLAPRFKALGHPVFDVAYIKASGSTANALGSAAAGLQNAVLRFSNDCVDHVAFVSATAVDALFMLAADQQNYRPRYGLSSLESPPVVVPNLPDPDSQLRGAMGPGWAPYMDVDEADFDAAALSPSARCADVLKRSGQTPADNNAWILALPSCEGPYFVQDVIARLSRAPSSTTLLAVVDELGSAYRASGSFATKLGPGKHDGASGYRGVAYTQACSCFRYTSALRTP